MKTSIKQTLIAAGLLAAAGAAFAQAPAYKRDLPAKLVKQAKIAEADAAKTALTKAPTGEIRAVELENEGGRLIYSYELKVPGKSGIEEVNVNAKTGKIVNTEHESAASEQAEEKSEKSPKKAAKKPER